MRGQPMTSRYPWTVAREEVYQWRERHEISFYWHIGIPLFCFFGIFIYAVITGVSNIFWHLLSSMVLSSVGYWTHSRYLRLRMQSKLPIEWQERILRWTMGQVSDHVPQDMCEEGYLFIQSDEESQFRLLGEEQRFLTAASGYRDGGYMHEEMFGPLGFDEQFRDQLQMTIHRLNQLAWYHLDLINWEVARHVGQFSATYGQESFVEVEAKKTGKLIELNVYSLDFEADLHGFIARELSSCKETSESSKRSFNPVPMRLTGEQRDCSVQTVQF